MKYSLVAMLLHISSTIAQDCLYTEIRCADGNSCTPVAFLCDNEGDCPDGSDENREFCELIEQDPCNFNEVTCIRDGSSSCTSLWAYCSLEEDTPCEGDLDKRICKMIKNVRIDSLDKFNLTKATNFNKSQEHAKGFDELLTNTLSSTQCPFLYTRIGGECISFFHVAAMSWAESREFCNYIKGDLMTFRDVRHFTNVIQHIKRFGLSSDFWIGGYNRNSAEGWIWTDDTPMEIGSLNWATRYSEQCIHRQETPPGSEPTCSHYYQAPKTPPSGHCVSLSYEHFFLMSDDDCLKKMSPMCIYNGFRGSQKLRF